VTTTYPAGFRAAGVAAGIKKSGNHDVAVVINDGPSTAAAAVFTSNRIKAAPVLWSQQVVADGDVRAVVLNSGGANACTGPDGFADTHHTAEFAADILGCGAGQVAICSTGLIGERLPMDYLLPGVQVALAAAAADGGPSAARAIMTTDSVPKTASSDGDGFRVGGMAKGAGMLAPGLATMLVVITTDALVTPQALDTALRAATRTTFDRIDSDGCMSTNDTVIAMASGASGVTPSMFRLTSAIADVCASLARQLIADAEGATKDIEIEVRNAASEDDAVTVARSIARSNLLKCAIHGEDPNWGRILSALGTTDAAYDPLTIDVAINGVWVCRNSAPGEARTAVSMAERTVRITVDLKAGRDTATLWTNDLTAMYVHENSAYAT
jgi:glutamate N-acetyltransferase/amino-acid N-acetyltransferase